MTNESGVPHFALNAVRIVVGTLFFLNGFAKLTGHFGWDLAEPGSLMWWAGAIESSTGFLIAIGFLTRPAAFAALLLMLAAYWRVHFPQAWIPAANQNGGERPVLYGLWFFYLMLKGGGSFSIEGLLAARKRDRI
jgi:putative oxidoreductase